MSKRSLLADAQGLIQAKEAMARKQWTHQVLAKKVGLKTRQSIGNFFAGRAVERRIFIEICFQLDLAWQEVATQVQSESLQTRDSADKSLVVFNSLVTEVRSRCQEKIETQCGIVPLWDFPKPMSLKAIYTEMEVLEDIPNRHWLEITDWRHYLNSQPDWHTLGLNWDITPQTRVSAMTVLAQQRHLIIWGKPGTGKTTLLQYVATQCNQGLFAPDQVPIYIELRLWAEAANSPSLLDYICQEFSSCGVSGETVKELLHEGKLLILLDGWDEVIPCRRLSLTNQLRWFCHRYDHNRFVITCRNAAALSRFGRFTEVELADWTLTHIGDFVRKYFLAVSGVHWEAGLAKAAEFIHQLEYPENRTILDMGRIPLLLGFLCQVFQSQGRFPRQQARLYQEGWDILLWKWDQWKGMNRDPAEQPLSLVNRLKVLAQVASVTFAQQEYGFDSDQVAYLIGDYLRLLPKYQNIDWVTLSLKSQEVLNSLICHHGLLVERSRRFYSFSSASVQQYFTATEITTKAHQNPEGIAELVTHLLEKPWRQIFLFTVTQLRYPERLIQAMKTGVDQVLRGDQRLGQFLIWIAHRAESSLLSYKLAAVRAFYLALALSLDQAFVQTLNANALNQPLETQPLQHLSAYLSLALTLDPQFKLADELKFKLQESLPMPLCRTLTLNATIDRSLKYNLALDSERLEALARSLKLLLEPVWLCDSNLEALNQWWSDHRDSWVKRVTFLLGQHDHGQHDWQFNPKQTRSLWDYYDANRLLIDCLTMRDDLNPEIRQQIENELFLYQD